MLAELIRSDLDTGSWFLRPQGAEDMQLIDLAPIWSAKVRGRSGWFEVLRDGDRWRVIRFVAGLAVDNGPVKPRKSWRSPAQHTL